MKKLLIVSAISFLVYSQAYCQFQFGPSIAYLKGTESNSGNGQWGGGLFARYLIANRFGIGATFKVYPKNAKSETVNVNGTDYRISSSNLVVPALVTLDYRLGKSEVVRPYIGVDAGAYSTRFVTDVSSNSSETTNTTNKKWYFGAAPKVGIEIGGPIGFFGQVQYNALFGSGDKNDLTIPGATSSIDTKPTMKFWSFEAGLYFKIGKTD